MGLSLGKVGPLVRVVEKRVAELYLWINFSNSLDTSSKR